MRYARQGHTVAELTVAPSQADHVIPFGPTLEGVVRRVDDHEAPALGDIVCDVAVIDRRQHAAPAVAVEYDQVEFRQLDLEQFADRKGDLVCTFATPILGAAGVRG